MWTSLCNKAVIVLIESLDQISKPPKNEEIALWPKTRVVKWGARQRRTTKAAARHQGSSQ